jgi:acetyltransferase-like isoleucine patch superfamily enzyme
MLRTLFAAVRRIIASLWLPYANRSKQLKIGMFSICEAVKFGRFNTIHKFVRLKNVSMGDLSYIANGARVQNATMGKFCSIGPNCKIGLGAHPSRRFVSTHPSFYSTHPETSITFVNSDHFIDHAPINIGNDVWVGESAIVLDGVTISDGVIVGAGAVVTKDVPPYAVVVGVPAKIVRYRFDEPEIAMLLRSRWWDNDLDWVRQNASLFTDIELLRPQLSAFQDR